MTHDMPETIYLLEQPLSPSMIVTQHQMAKNHTQYTRNDKYEVLQKEYEDLRQRALDHYTNHGKLKQKYERLVEKSRAICAVLPTKDSRAYVTYYAQKEVDDLRQVLAEVEKGSDT